jgi:hypothetical protein
VAKFQPVKFKTVDEFLDHLPEDELKVVVLLRKLIFDCLPGITEKLSYNVPFYKIHKGLFFIWPASVLWGKKNNWTGTRFGFQQGNLLNDDINYLDKGDRKQVFYKNFVNVKEIDTDILKSYIFEAALIDQQFSKIKRS